MSEKLLIVEDDKKLNDGIRLALKNDACKSDGMQYANSTKQGS